MLKPIQKTMIYAMCIGLLAACGGKRSTADTVSEVMDTQAAAADSDPFLVKSVDLTRYVGEWYEIASLPRSFQSFCQKTKAIYAIKSDKEVSVINTCKVGFAPITIQGTARVVDEKTNAVLEVSLGNINRKADYRIIALDSEYQYALVTNKDRSSLFVLSRTSELADSIYESLLSRAKSAGIDITKVKKTSQK